MSSPEAQRLVERLAAELGRSVVVNDPEIRLLHASQHFGDEDEVRVRAILHRDPGAEVIQHILGLGVASWMTGRHVPGVDRLGLSTRYVVPVRHRRELLGFAMVIDAEETLTPQERTAIDELADQVASLLVEERHAADATEVQTEADVRALLGRDLDERDAAACRLRELGVLPGHEHARVLVVEGEATPVSLRHALTTTGRSQRGAALSAVEPGRGVLLQVTTTPMADAAAEKVARLVLEAVTAFPGAHGIRVGLGPAVPAARAWESHRRAGLAARAAAVLPGPVVHWRDIGPLDVLLRIAPDELDATIVPDALRRLVEADPDGRLAETLEAFLRHGGSASAAARELHLHRTTLYYRLDRIRDLSGADLDDGRVRLELHLGLLALKVIGTR